MLLTIPFVGLIGREGGPARHQGIVQLCPKCEVSTWPRVVWLQLQRHQKLILHPGGCRDEV